MKYFRFTPPKGFTLIELLVVISIISLLSSVIMTGIGSTKTKSRDAVRLANVKQIQNALELYYSKNGKYPDRYANTYQGGCGSNWCLLETDLAEFLNTLPRDPRINDDNYRYYYDSDSGDGNRTYGLMVRMEHSSNFSKVTSDGGYYNSASSGGYYEVGQQPGYCMGSSYPSPNNNWWGSQTTVCTGGN